DPRWGTHGLGISVARPPHLPVLLGTVQGTGDVEEQVRGAQDGRPLLLGEAEPGALLAKAVRPPVGQPEARHGAGEKVDVVRTVPAGPAFHGVIRLPP